MKSSKINLAVIIAVLTLGMTVISKASTKVISRCFTVVTVSDGSASFSLDASFTCAQANFIKNGGAIHLIAGSLANSLQDETFCPAISNEIFCCIKVTEVPTDPIAQPLNLGEGAKKYQIAGLYCKPE